MSDDAGMGVHDEVFSDEDAARLRVLLANLKRDGHVSPLDAELLDRHFTAVRPTRLVALGALHQALNAPMRIN